MELLGESIRIFRRWLRYNPEIVCRSASDAWKIPLTLMVGFLQPGLLIPGLFFLVGLSVWEASLRPGAITVLSSSWGNILEMDCGAVVLHDTVSQCCLLQSPCITKLILLLCVRSYNTLYVVKMYFIFLWCPSN